MKISVLTPTYNRANLLTNLYNSLVKNSNYGLEIEWLIMDDGSTDNTLSVVENFIKQNKIDIKYFKQENQGKMVAINNLVEKATGELIVDCDSDDYFFDDAFKIIKESYEKYPNENQELYGMCFLKYDTKGQNMGQLFKNEKTTMFDLYFKEGEDGEKALVFYSNIRKQFKHELEHGEKFVTEARMYHKMDENYKILCINEIVEIGDYLDDGYTRNYEINLKQNPMGYRKYYEEICKKGLKGMPIRKKLHILKAMLFLFIQKNRYSQ